MERTHGRTDVLGYTLCTTKFIHQRGLQGDRKLVFVWEEKILARGNNNMYVRILESLFIYKIRPDLNDGQSAFPLNIVGR